MKYLVITCAVIFAVCGCSTPQEKSQEELIIGHWKALWETDPGAYPELAETKTFTMDGRLIFKEDGSLTISAYGYPECIFSTDTLTHELNWKIENDTINFISGADPYGIPYSIERIEENEIELKLMEDIFLKLRREN
jgi:hypothetical protein